MSKKNRSTIKGPPSQEKRAILDVAYKLGLSEAAIVLGIPYHRVISTVHYWTPRTGVEGLRPDKCSYVSGCRCTNCQSENTLRQRQKRQVGRIAQLALDAKHITLPGTEDGHDAQIEGPWEQIYSGLQTAILPYLTATVGSDVAPDYFHDSLLGALQLVQSGEAQTLSQIVRYARRIARQLVLLDSGQRKQQRLLRNVDDYSNALPSTIASPESNYCGKELRQFAYGMIGKLTASVRDILIDHFRQEQSGQGIRRTLNLRDNNFRKRRAKAVERLIRKCQETLTIKGGKALNETRFSSMQPSHSLDE